MFLPINGRIAIIDNVIEEVEPLFKIFCKNRIPYIFIQGDDMDCLPEEDDETNDLRIIFLDLNLLGERTPSVKEVKSSLYPILNRVISKNNFPYSIIIWSKQQDNYLEVVKELFETELSDRQPIAIEPFIKSDFFELDGEAKDLPRRDIIDEMKKILLSHQSYSTLIYWENKVHKSADIVLQDIFKSFEIIDWNNNSNFIISKLGENYLGKTTYKNSNYVEQTKGSLQAFNSIFIDSLEYNIFSKSNLLEQPKLEYDDTTINISNLIGIVNEKLLFSKSDLVIKCTGTVTEDQDPKSEKVFKSVLNDSFDRFQVESEIEFSKDEQKDEKIRKKKIDKESSKKRKEIRKNWQKVYLVVTPLCDYIQNKNRNIRLIKGFIISNSEKKYIDSKSDAILITPPYYDSDYNEMRAIVFNYRYFFTFGDLFNVKDLKPLFRLRNQLVAEIQSKLARHINRQGILFFRSQRMIDYTTIQSTSAEPEASAMIETFRAIGYSIETAIADIIDNSITAGAKNIWIDYDWKGSNTTLSIMDDGTGMNNDLLIQAMRPGSRNPLDERNRDDLGRFGLGLKTASFSQTRKFTILSKAKDFKPVFWTWDLDYVNQTQAWKLIRFIPNEEDWIGKIESIETGTCVVWWDLDRLTKDTSEDSEKAKFKFLEVMDSVKSHLSMVFHRYMDEGLKIYFRAREIKSWDPFMIGIDGLQSKPETRLESGSIRIKGFVLPHRSKLSAEQYNYGKGPQDSWTAHQGFYVYRNRRLLVAGDWLGFFKKEVHYDLCRIQIDLPNHFDDDWQIDIKKSIARPPSIYREQILALAKEARNQAVEVYRHKGRVLKRKLSKDEYFPFWEERARHGKRFYKINRNHPLLNDLLSNSGDLKKDIEKVIQFIEETIPIPLITLQENENEKPHGQPFEGIDHNAMRETMQKLFNRFISTGLSIEKAKARILNTEPYNFYPEYIEFLTNE